MGSMNGMVEMDSTAGVRQPAEAEAAGVQEAVEVPDPEADPCPCEAGYRMMFENHPIPMWVFDRETLRFLAVNAAAIRQYGFTAEEFLAMTIAEIRPTEDVPALFADVAKRTPGLQIPGVWRHRRKNGERIDVEIVCHSLDFRGIDAMLVSANDVTERQRSAELLRNSELKYRALFEDSADAYWLTDENGTLDCNSEARRIFGYAAGENMPHPASLSPPHQPDGTPSLEAGLAHAAAALRTGKERFEWIHQRKNGETFPADVFLAAITLSGKGLTLGTVRDITERKRAEELLLFKTALLEAQTETTLDGILVVDEAGRILLTNRQFRALFGIPEGLLDKGDDLPVRMFATSKIEDPVAFNERVNYLYEHREEKSRDELRLKDGTTLDRYSSPLVDAKGEYRGRIWYFRDITAAKDAEARSQFLALHDALTGLPHRVLLQDRLNTALAAARRRNEKIALLFLDLDRFKSINDTFGHSYGDAVLKEVARRLSEWAREQDTVARLGGDEFLIMLSGVKDAASAAIAAERILEAMRHPFLVQHHSLRVDCSIGVSMFPENGSDGETLIKNADAALYCAKDRGRGSVRFFTGQMNAEAEERLLLEKNLRLAVERAEFFLVYQPQVDLASGAVTGMEALIRWKQRDGGLIPPDAFISIAENTGLILPIGEWALRAACTQARVWHEAGFDVPVAVNVSAVQFRQQAFLHLLRQVLEETGLPAHLLELELTENVLLTEADLTFSTLREMKELGVRLAIDDFGTGYSSLSYLKHFRVDKIKIDRSFVRDLAANPDDAAITSSIISMARSLKLKVVAEGVENETQMAFLRKNQCDEIQGFYVSRPIAADEVLESLAMWHEINARMRSLSVSRG
ncbi:MAG TPA: EAL domain-containing protein [Acidobacteriaceae bacterium]